MDKAPIPIEVKETSSKNELLLITEQRDADDKWYKDYYSKLVEQVRKETRREIFTQIEEAFIWGQVPYYDLEKGKGEWTMHCISDEDWQSLKGEEKELQQRKRRKGK